MRWKGFLFDLDGTVYHGAHAIPGAPELFSRLTASGIPFRCVTNRSNRTPAAVAEQLRSLGIPCLSEHVITSAGPTAAAVGGQRVYCIGEAGLRDALLAAGCELTDLAPDAVVVGYDQQVTMGILTVATRLIRSGARFLATNPDPYITTEQGIVPENGAILAALTAATEVHPTVLGKPDPAIANFALAQIGVKAKDAVLIGDNPATDIACGHAAGTETVLMLTGVTTRAALDSLPCSPTCIAENYAELMSLIGDDNA